MYFEVNWQGLKFCYSNPLNFILKYSTPIYLFIFKEKLSPTEKSLHSNYCSDDDSNKTAAYQNC